MGIEPQTVKCPIRGKPYTFYPNGYAGDQSACPECRSIARSKEYRWLSNQPSN